MPITGQLIFASMVFIFLLGLILLLTSFKSRGRGNVGQRQGDEYQRSSIAGRVALGLILMFLGGGGFLFFWGMAGLAEMAQH